jgi:hypothetical protein
MAQAIVVMLSNPEMFRAVINRITDFYLRPRNFYESTKDA